MSSRCRQEISKIYQKSMVVSAIEATVSSSPTLALFLSVLFLVLSDWGLNPANAFMLLAFTKLLKASFLVYLNQGLRIAFEAIVSLNRIEEFLLLEELPSPRYGCDVSKTLREDTLRSDESASNVCRKKNKHQLQRNTNGNKEKSTNRSIAKDEEPGYFYKETEDALVISSLSYKGTEETSRYVLYDVSFLVPRHSLTVLRGRVGSGKSTLLSAIAGQISLLSGTVKYPGTLAYVTQVPWVFSGTIKENILFSESYDPDWYSTVVEACALKDDIELFPDKHETIVGERGVVLSGGQKARVSLARAVYSCADVFVLDDPLSAVDQRVGDHIFEKCICDLLGRKIRLLVSHHSRYFKGADEIITLVNGRVLDKRRPQLEGTEYTEPVISYTPLGGYQAPSDPLDGQSAAYRPRGMVIPAEDRAIGHVSFRLYWDYFTSGIHPVLLVMLIALFFLTQRKQLYYP